MTRPFDSLIPTYGGLEDVIVQCSDAMVVLHVDAKVDGTSATTILDVADARALIGALEAALAAMGDAERTETPIDATPRRRLDITLRSGVVISTPVDGWEIREDRLSITLPAETSADDRARLGWLRQEAIDAIVEVTE